MCYVKHHNRTSISISSAISSHVGFCYPQKAFNQFWLACMSVFIIQPPNKKKATKQTDRHKAFYYPYSYTYPNKHKKDIRISQCFNGKH